MGIVTTIKETVSFQNSTARTQAATAFGDFSLSNAQFLALVGSRHRSVLLGILDLGRDHQATGYLIVSIFISKRTRDNQGNVYS